MAVLKALYLNRKSCFFQQRLQTIEEKDEKKNLYRKRKFYWYEEHVKHRLWSAIMVLINSDRAPDRPLRSIKVLNGAYQIKLVYIIKSSCWLGLARRKYSGQKREKIDMFNVTNRKKNISKNWKFKKMKEKSAENDYLSFIP